MTRITQVKVRETDIEYRGRKLVIEAHPRVLYLRLKGARSEGVRVAYDAIYELGLKLAARRQR